MPTLQFIAELPASLEKCWQFHASAEALELLTPRGRQLEFLGGNLNVVVGAEQRFRVKQFGIWTQWAAKIIVVEPPDADGLRARFVDQALKSPFKAWQHEHRFERATEFGTKLTDTVTYELPLGFLGAIADALFVRRQLVDLFAFRHAETIKALR